MSAPEILINTLSNECGLRDAVEHAVIQALSPKPGHWSASLLEARDDDGSWRIVVEGPDNVRKRWTFAPDTQEPSIVSAALARDL